MKANYQLRALLCLSLALAGCNVCAKLDERMCNDLGPEDCALWKENGMNFEAQTEGREGRRGWLKKLLFGANSTQCDGAGSDAVYTQILNSTKQAMSALRKAKELGSPAEQ